LSTPPWKYAEVARILLEHGADVAALNNDRSTAFRLALQQGGRQGEDVFLEHGATGANGVYSCTERRYF
jgi:ankyrin repeat protein